MTPEEAMELTGLERDIAQLERAINNPNLAASNRGGPEHQAALERITQKRMRVDELRRLSSSG